MVESADTTNGIPVSNGTGISITKPLKHDTPGALESHFNQLPPITTNTCI
jgi:hypothetical protein